MRNIAFDVLNDVNEKKIFVNLRLKDLDSNNCDINNITIRVYGVLQNYNFLEYKVLETTKDKKIDHKTKLILMMAIFEKMFLDNTPEYAIISEYTNLAARKNQKAKKFISYYLNNVLDEAVNAYPKFKNQEKNESIIYSMPQWIVKKIKLQYKDDYLQILESMNKKKNISLE